VVVFVAPSGARAASAGLFITLASHVAAMAPGTHIGAAHPVQIGTLPIAPPQPADDEEKKTDRQPSPIEEKSVNDTKAWARSLAELRDRNAEWAELAVTESRSITAQAAVDQHVVDLIATDLSDLLRKLDGREVSLQQDQVRLETKDAALDDFEMWWGERLLGVISSPNIAFLLLIFGFYGVLFEFYSPGWGVAGTLGAVLLLLGFFGLAVLPLNYAGLALLALALALFVAEAFVVSYGALTVGGIICLILGGLMLVDSPVGFMRVSMAVVIPVAVGTGIITFLLLGSVIKAHRGRVQTGAEGLIGSLGVAKNDFEAAGDRFQGTIWVHGEYWRALSAGAVRMGQQVSVVDREGLTLNVEATPDPESAAISKTPPPDKKTVDAEQHQG
jgi:membrane-bound serine protease (ClpP class)